jgi:FixJ family two-component response regulator/glycine cleavage system H lipoate-binding protein
MSKAVDVLVIDDEQVVREGVGRVCEMIGLTIDAAGDAASGLEKLIKGHFRLVLCDIMLPDHDGFHVLHSMRKAGNRTPVVMITGCSTLQNAVNSLRDGALDIIPKPFTVDELESGIQRGLRYQKLLEQAVPRQSEEQAVWSITRSCPKESYRLGKLSWVSVEQDGSARVGVTDLFIKIVSRVNAIQFSEVNHELAQAAPCATLTTEDNGIHQILSPLSGGVIRRNGSLLTDVTPLIQDPYGAGWLYQIVPTNLAFELNHLTSCVHDY